MIQTEPALAELYVADETAWLDAMADRIAKSAYRNIRRKQMEKTH